MKLAIDNLNTLTRSYNLLAPSLAQKPYFSLERELQACFADVAPLVADAIKDRAAWPPPREPVSGGSRLGLLERFETEGKTAKIYDSQTPHYGFKEMWRDIWGEGKA